MKPKLQIPTTPPTPPSLGGEPAWPRPCDAQPGGCPSPAPQPLQPVVACRPPSKIGCVVVTPHHEQPSAGAGAPEPASAWALLIALFFSAVLK